MKRVLSYLNPIEQLGKRKYSTVFPIGVMLGMCVIFEVAYRLTNNSSNVGLFILFVSIALIIYLAFRDGIRGGVIATVITILYYVYIVTNHSPLDKRTSGLETTGILTILYFILAGIIGWLKITIDRLIDREAYEKRRLQTIIQQLPVGVIITDQSGQLVETNRQLESILGIRIPKGFMMGKDTLPGVQINGKPLNPSQSPLVKALASGKSFAGREMIYQHKDGRNVHLRVSSAPIHNRKGQIIAAASIISDITNMKEMEKRKDDFINMASHELKTPITSMKLYIDILLRQLDRDKHAQAHKLTKSIEYQTQRLQELVSDLLDVSRLQTGKLMFSKEEFRLDELITQTVEELQGITKQQKIVVTSSTPVKVIADRFRIYQVFTNLITNAVKYSEPGTEIRVSVKRSEGKALVSVQDQGMGIPKDQHKKIFDRLYQIRDEQGKSLSGLGMGLYIYQEIIRRHNGSIWVESEVGKGSTFSFTLPLKTSVKKK